MKHCYLSLVAWALCACASAPRHDPQAVAPAAPPTPPAVIKPVLDVIAGQVVGEEPMMEVSKHASVRLLRGGSEIASLTADPQGEFRFEGPFPKGRYEITVRDGKLHGSREISFAGGEMSGLSVLVTDGKGDHHHRRRRRKH